jgi:hypothetical protein
MLISWQRLPDGAGRAVTLQSGLLSDGSLRIVVNNGLDRNCAVSVLWTGYQP